MAAHTAGPWEAEAPAARGAWIKGANGEWTALACGDNDETASANARLIASAPALLEALEALVREFFPPPAIGDCPELVAARAAITLARTGSAS